MKQQFGAASVQFHVAELVDAEEVDAAVAGDGLVELLCSPVRGAAVVQRDGAVRLAGLRALRQGIGGHLGVRMSAGALG
ncbi:hypothetical protein DQ384_01405 [Sphaerisporangium album]|uniref:Uncharacterized protein n=1 Tax=Sphaerisporangium album TaxID=509200 RepID=A0A367FUI8_9ACTN|nr:hypothetical protein DQ384_01405 [Sphaerisporangium album]